MSTSSHRCKDIPPLAFAWGLATLLMLPFDAGAIPAFNRQTGPNCVACRAGGQFPELTPYGRLFKMTGYTIGLAAYCAAQPATPQPVEGERSRLDAGKSIFESDVPDKGIPARSGCHGAKGEGNAPFPRIAGQHVDYVVKQQLVFQRTDERPEGKIMKTVAHEPTRQHIRDVATYVQVLPSL